MLYNLTMMTSRFVRRVVVVYVCANERPCKCQEKKLNDLLLIAKMNTYKIYCCCFKKTGGVLLLLLLMIMMMMARKVIIYLFW